MLLVVRDNLTAFVNRLTALFRQNRFYEKRLYGLIVSGYSGGDLLARQLISGLNMNKSFYLPPEFCLMETANEKGSLVKLPGVAPGGRRKPHQYRGSPPGPGSSAGTRWPPPGAAPEPSTGSTGCAPSPGPWSAPWAWSSWST